MTRLRDHVVGVLLAVALVGLVTLAIALALRKDAREQELNRLLGEGVQGQMEFNQKILERLEALERRR